MYNQSAYDSIAGEEDSIYYSFNASQMMTEKLTSGDRKKFDYPLKNNDGYNKIEGDNCMTPMTELAKKFQKILKPSILSSSTPNKQNHLVSTRAVIKDFSFLDEADKHDLTAEKTLTEETSNSLSKLKSTNENAEENKENLKEDSSHKKQFIKDNKKIKENSEINRDRKLCDEIIDLTNNVKSQKISSPVNNQDNNTRKINKVKFLETGSELKKQNLERRRTLHAEYTFPKKRQSLAHKSKENSNIGRSYPRLSIAKTTFNSPAIVKNMRKTIYHTRETRKSISIQTQLKDASRNPKTTTITTDKKNKNVMLKPNFVCSQCLREFRVASIFETHKKSHDTSNSENKCNFCDKKFAKIQTFQNHLLEKCTKIPLNERKRILEQYSGNKSKTDKVQNSFDKQNSEASIRISPASDQIMGPPTTNKIKKKLPHSGVYRTPSKCIKCYSCCETFNSVLAYTEHMLSHENN